MADVTTIESLRKLVTACGLSPLVESYVVRDMDEDTLSARVYLQSEAFGGEAFISAFYNIATDKVALALVAGGRRLYGKDNAKVGWHVHPFEGPEEHCPCQAVDFGEFLDEVEAYHQETRS